MKEVATENFNHNTEGLRKVDWKSRIWKFKDQNKYDDLIRGWTKYWNDIFSSKDPLDPNLVKALIATESEFKPNTIVKIPKDIARGLMQMMDSTRKYLSDPKYKELRNHLVNITDKDALDPNFNIAAGIRWLFRKREVAKAECSFLTSAMMRSLRMPFEKAERLK